MKGVEWWLPRSSMAPLGSEEPERWQELGEVEVHLGDDGRDCPQWPETNTD